MKRFLTTLLFFFLSASVASAHEAPIDIPPLTGEHIESFNTDIKVNRDGTIEVTENIYYDFSALDRHGIYRYIPYTKRNSHDKRVDLKFEDIKVTDGKGKDYKFDQSNENEQIVLKIGDPDKTITGAHLYQISYKVSGALGYFDDYDELYWNIAGNGWEVPIRFASTHITLPENINLDDIEGLCFTGSYGATSDNCDIEVIENTIHIQANYFLNSYEGLTVVIGFPKGTIAFLPPTLYVSFWETPMGKITIGTIILGAIFWYLVLPGVLIFRYFKHGRDPYVGIAPTAWYDPPKGKRNRHLTPAETGSLLDETVHSRDVFSVIIDLARRGYITINEYEKKKFELIFKNKPITKDKLLPFEQTLLDGIFGSAKEVRLKDVKFYTTTQKVEKMIYEDMVSEGFFTSNPNTQRAKYYVLGTIAFTTFNFILGLTAIIAGRAMPRKTLEGARAAQVAQGMKNFLSSQERQLNFQGDRQMFFEKLLPFAVAFGVEKNWAERFKEFDLRSPDWYQGYSGSHFTTAYFASSLANSHSSFSSSSTPPSSSGSGFSGGSSGGGGGGGGGGSW